jgi:hypothetical protein
MSEEIFSIIEEDVPDEILEKMPEWFKILRDAYLHRVAFKHNH